MAREPKPFDRSTIEQAFERLGEMALAAGKIVEISVYGGAALLLVLKGRPATQDVDAVFDHDRAFIRHATGLIAEDFGWDADWLNDGVKGFLSTIDAQSKSLFGTYPSEETPGLRVFLASPEYLFAMKCMAMRVGGEGEKQDTTDIRRLADLLGIRSAKAAVDVVTRYYPATRISPKTQFGLEEIFGQT